MKTILALLFVLSALNLVLFVATKAFGWLELHLFKLFFKDGVAQAVFDHPEFKERSKVKSRYTHWFWSVWIVLFYAISPLNGLNYYLALFGGLVLYFVGSAESNALAAIAKKYRERAYVEEQELTKNFFEELGARIQAVQTQEKKDE